MRKISRLRRICRRWHADRQELEFAIRFSGVRHVWIYKQANKAVDKYRQRAKDAGDPVVIHGPDDWAPCLYAQL